MNAKDAALAFAIDSYSKQLENLPPTKTTTVTFHPPTHRQKKANSSQALNTGKEVSLLQAVEIAKNAPNQGVTFTNFPEKGSFSAKEFILAFRKAKVRDEKIAAISGFIGYNHGEDFGNQENLAMAQAKRDLSPSNNPLPTREEKRTAQRSVFGYVKGMPDNQAKITSDLLAREHLALESKNDYIKQAKDKSLPIHERQLSIGLARLEDERLKQIAQDPRKR